MNTWRHLRGPERRLFVAVILAAFIIGTGFGAIFPVLPVLVTNRGAGVGVLALMAGSYILSSFLFQYPLAALADRFGPRRVILVVLIAYGLLGFGFVLPSPPAVLVGLRFLQGIANGGFGPAERSLIGRYVPRAMRGEAFGTLAAADMAGIVLGPVIGGAVGSVAPPEAVFLMEALLALFAAATFYLAAPRGPMPVADPEPGVASAVPASWRDLMSADLIGVSVLSTGSRYLFGLYDTVWVIFMHGVGATSLQTGLSISVFALPAMFLATPFGRLGDRVDRRLPLVISQAGMGLIAGVYPLLPNVTTIFIIGAVEGTLVALGRPNQYALVAAAAPAGMEARAQAFANAFGLIGDITAPALTAALYPIDHHLPFYAGSAFTTSFTAVGTVLVYRPGSQIPGHPGHHLDAPSIPGEPRAPALGDQP